MKTGLNGAALAGLIFACASPFAFAGEGKPSNPFPKRPSRPAAGATADGAAPSSGTNGGAINSIAADGAGTVVVSGTGTRISGEGSFKTAGGVAAPSSSGGFGGGGGGGSMAAVNSALGISPTGSTPAPGTTPGAKPAPAPATTPAAALTFAKAPGGADVSSFKSGELIYGKMTGLDATGTYGCTEVLARGDTHCSNPGQWTLLPNNDWKYVNGAWVATIVSGAFPPGDYKCYFRRGASGTAYSKILTILPPTYSWIAVVVGPCDPGPQPGHACGAGNVGERIKNSCGDWFCHASN